MNLTSKERAIGIVIAGGGGAICILLGIAFLNGVLAIIGIIALLGSAFLIDPSGY